MAAKLAVDFPQNVSTFFSECNSDRIGQNIQKWGIAGKIYLWSCCCLSIIIYTLWAEAFWSSSISREGLKGALCDEIKLEQYSRLERIEFRKTKTESWVSRNQHVLYSPLESISGNDLFLEKRNNNHSHIYWMHGPTELASTIWAKFCIKSIFCKDILSFVYHVTLFIYM